MDQQGHTNTSDKPPTTEGNWLTKSEDWVSHAAAMAYTEGQSLVAAAKPAIHAGHTLLLGAGQELHDHPLQLAGEVALGAGVIACADGLGLGALAVSAIAVLPLAGYEVYQGLKIAHKEGIGAIPKHITETLASARATVTNTIDSELHPERHTATERTQADANLRSVGAAGLNFAAGALGGPAKQAGEVAVKTLIRAGDNMAANLIESTFGELGMPGLRPAWATSYPSDPLPPLTLFESSPIQTLTGSALAGEGSSLINSLAPKTGQVADALTPQPGPVYAEASPNPSQKQEKQSEVMVVDSR